MISIFEKSNFSIELSKLLSGATFIQGGQHYLVSEIPFDANNAPKCRTLCINLLTGEGEYRLPYTLVEITNIQATYTLKANTNT